jgi:hypothetical protein
LSRGKFRQQGQYPVKALIKSLASGSAGGVEKRLSRGLGLSGRIVFR